MTDATLFSVPPARLARFAAACRRQGASCQVAVVDNDLAWLRVAPTPFAQLLLATGHEGGVRGYRWHDCRWVDIVSGRPCPHPEVVFSEPPELLLSGPVRFRDSRLDIKIKQRLGLGYASDREPATMWVLAGEPTARLLGLASDVHDGIIGQLKCAISPHGAVLLASTPPPALVLRDAIGFRPYLQLANLYVPVGTTLYPKLRRDTARLQLAADQHQLTWLWPTGGRSFSCQHIAKAALRPLHEQIAYATDAVAAGKAAVYGSWPFEAFAVADEAVVREAPPAKEAKQPKPPPVAKPKPAKVKAVPLPAPVSMPVTSDAQQQLLDLQEAFLAAAGHLDSPERQALWPQLAAVNAVLGHADEAAICWQHGYWQLSRISAEQAAAWLKCEGYHAGADAHNLELFLDSVGKAQNNLPPSTADLRRIVAWLLWAVAKQHQPGRSVLHNITTYLVQHDAGLGIRAAWLAWCCLSKLAGNDALLLARASDRWLARLLQHGLRPHLDTPAMFRVGQQHGLRFQAIRRSLDTLRTLVQQWLAKKPVARTSAYADMLFAYAHAKLGEPDTSSRLFDAAVATLPAGDVVHQLLSDCFAARIAQAAAGVRSNLPADLLAKIADLTKSDTDRAFKVERLRESSLALEPHNAVNPYAMHSRDALEATMAALRPLPAEQFLASVQALLPKQATYEKLRLLSFSLADSDRLGGSLATALLSELAKLSPELAKLQPVQLDDAAVLLGRGLFLAGHYGNSQLVQTLTNCLSDLLGHKAVKLDQLDKVAGSAISNLRRLGLTSEACQLLGDVTAAAAKQPLAQSLRSRLQVAAGWLHFSEPAKALPTLDEARTILLSKPLPATEQTQLARAYVTAVAGLPANDALDKLADLFSNLAGMSSGLSTCSHYCLDQLRLIDTVVALLTSDNFTSAELRRWLDEDEYLVRRRIHADVAKAMNPGATASV